jgi:hypothetical protein
VGDTDGSNEEGEMMAATVNTTEYTTVIKACQELTNLAVAEGLYAQYDMALGEALGEEGGEYDTSCLFSRAYGIGNALNDHLEKAFGIERDLWPSFWDFCKAGFDVPTAIKRLRAQSRDGGRDDDMRAYLMM